MRRFLVQADGAGAWSLRVPELGLGESVAQARVLGRGGAFASLPSPAATIVAERPLTIAGGPTFTSFAYGPVIAGTGHPGATVSVALDGEPLHETVVSDEGTWSIDLSDVEGGAYALTVAQQSDVWQQPVLEAALEVDPIPEWVLDEATLDVDFLERRAYRENSRADVALLSSASFLALFTFSRESAGTYWDADGRLAIATAGVPRFDHDPVSGAPRGILIEGVRTNLCTYSNDISAAAWAKSGLSVAGNAGVSKDGTANADFLLEEATTAQHYVLDPGTSYSSGTTYTTTCMAKASNRVLQIVLSSPRFGSNAWANFDLVAGTVGTVGSAAAARIVALGGGWYHCHVTATATSTGSGNARYHIVQSATSPRLESYAGDGASGLFLTFVQIEAGAVASSYIATTTAAAARATDVLSAAIDDWLTQGAGTWVVEWSQPVVDASLSGRVVQVDRGDNTDYLAPLVVGVTPRFNVVAGGATQAGINGAAASSGAVVRAAAAYAPNSFAFSTNGAAAGTDASGSVPAGLTTVRFGNSATGGHPLFGHVRRAAYRRDRVADADVPALAA